MVIHSLRRAVQLSRELCIRAPLRQQFEHFDLFCSQPGGIAARRFERAAWHASGAELAQSPATDLSKWLRAQTLSNDKCLAKRVLRAVSQSKRLLVTHPDPFPGVRGGTPLACNHEPVWLRYVMGYQVNGLRARLPP